MNDKDGGPAFPVTNEDHHAWGISMRDYFAAKAMLGIVQHEDQWGETVMGVAEQAYRIADCMLAARSA